MTQPFSAAADPSESALDDAIARLTRWPVGGAGLALAVGSLLWFGPGWLWHGLGLGTEPALPFGVTLLAATLTLTLGVTLAWKAHADTLTPAWGASLWIVGGSIPGVLAVYGWLVDPSQLAALVNDFPLLVWVATAGTSAALLRPRLSLALGTWGAAQYLVVFHAATPTLIELAGPELLVEVLVGPAAAWRRGLVLLGTGFATALVASRGRAAVLDLLREQRLRQQETARNHRLETERLRAEAASNHKTRLLADLSHELRTPLNAILGYAQLLAEAPGCPPEARRQAAVILESGRHLEQVLNDARDPTLIEGGELQLQVEPVDVGRLTREVCMAFRLQAEAASVSLVGPDAGNGALIAHVDARRLRQVVMNLVANALRHAAPTQVRIGVIAHETDRVEVTVADDGAGMDAGTLARIFEPNAASRSGRDRTTGLGLAISRKLLGAMDASIEVESIEGRGSTFRVWLPRHQGDAASPRDLPTEPLALPPAEVLAELREVAVRGDMSRVRSLLDDVDAEPSLRPFVQRIRAAADAFDDAGILALITSSEDSVHGL